jgi:hypothetical protein
MFGKCFDGYFCFVLLLSVFFFVWLLSITNCLQSPLNIHNAMKNQCFVLSLTKIMSLLVVSIVFSRDNFALYVIGCLLRLILNKKVKGLVPEKNVTNHIKLYDPLIRLPWSPQISHTRPGANANIFLPSLILSIRLPTIIISTFLLIHRLIMLEQNV